jgi:hypothetical protein
MRDTNNYEKKIIEIKTSIKIKIKIIKIKN